MKIRIQFSKKGPVKFIGHLDILRYFQKAFRRADFDLCYSQGFHPHPILSFASPLGVGLESEGEYMDLEVGSMDSPADMLARLNMQMTEGIEAVSLSLLQDDAKNSMAILAGADYRVDFREGKSPCQPEELAGMTEAFLTEEQILVQKKTKRHELEMDIRPMIHQVSVTPEGGLLMRLSAGSAANLKPEFLLQVMLERAGITLDPFALLVTRLEMYACDAEGRWIPLRRYQAVSVTEAGDSGAAGHASLASGTIA